MNESPSLNEKKVLITGSTGRLGQQIVQAFAGTGASLVTIDRSIKLDLVERNEHILLATRGDVTDESSVTEVFNHIIAEAGIPDVVIHTVGGWDGRPFIETSLEAWRSMLALNLTSAFLIFREALRHMKTQPGALIGITSGQGADKGVAQQAAYSATKGGLTRLIESIAAEYEGTGITAHAIAPSTILYEPPYDQPGVSGGDIGALCVYLASDAGRSLNGATLRAYGK